MQKVREILVGYIKPEALKYAVHPIGENGLASRIKSVGYLWHLGCSLRRRQCARFGVRHCRDVFLSLLQGTDIAWMTEVLRLMDKKETPKGKTLLQNLTVEQCHERFQNEKSVTSDQKAEEQRLYIVLRSEYEIAGLKNYRDKRMFHLDLQTIMAGNGAPKDVSLITPLLLEWFKHVGFVLDEDEPRYVTESPKIGKRVAREFRKMMVANQRAEIAKANRRAAMDCS
jgi:hypothetical protein